MDAKTRKNLAEMIPVIDVLRVADLERRVSRLASRRSVMRLTGGSR